MKVEALHIGMKVRHPQYGSGTVKSINEQTSEIRFDAGETRTIAPEPSGLEPAEAQVAISGLVGPLRQFVADTVQAVVTELGLDLPEAEVNQLAARWAKGRVVLHPSDPTLQTKEVPLDVFFHKIVMIRNNLRVLEQKLNGHPALSEAEKIELQQYITRSYGSMTTFNLLFKNKEDQFSGAAVS